MRTVFNHSIKATLTSASIDFFPTLHQNCIFGDRAPTIYRWYDECLLCNYMKDHTQNELESREHRAIYLCSRTFWDHLRHVDRESWAFTLQVLMPNYDLTTRSDFFDDLLWPKKWPISDICICTIHMAKQPKLDLLTKKLRLKRK